MNVPMTDHAGAIIKFGDSSRTYEFTRKEENRADLKSREIARDAAVKVADERAAARKVARAEAPAGLDDEEDPMAVRPSGPCRAPPRLQPAFMPPNRLAAMRGRSHALIGCDPCVGIS